MSEVKEKEKLTNEKFSISRKVGMAIADYNMLQDKDKIIVAVSGGKDSMSLLKLLQYRETFIPIDIEIMAVHLDMGMPGFPQDKLIELFKKWKVKYYIEKLNVLDERGWEGLNCFWCSWNRKKALFTIADKFGFNKIAMGHHMDDIVETVLLNLFYQGSISAMKPKQEFFGGKFTIIRPLAYIEEDLVRRFALKEGIAELAEYNCPRNDKSRRAMIKKLIKDLEKENPALKKNIFRSLERVKEDYLLEKE